jgi:hypothetical protein
MALLAKTYMHVCFRPGVTDAELMRLILRKVSPRVEGLQVNDSGVVYFETGRSARAGETLLPQGL